MQIVGRYGNLFESKQLVQGMMLNCEINPYGLKWLNTIDYFYMYQNFWFLF